MTHGIGVKASTLALAAALLGSVAGCSSEAVGEQRAAEPVGAEPAASVADPHADRTSTLAYHDDWRRLWEDHITWTRMVIIGILDSLPGTDVYIGRLLQNYEDMEDALAPYYGEDAAEEFGDLIKDHLTIAAAILVAAKAGDSAELEARLADWRANADALAAEMNELNPQAWPLAETRQMWHEHLDVTLEEATTHLAGDFTAELAAWEKVHEGGLMMADLFSDGVISQFPGSFTRSCR